MKGRASLPGQPCMASISRAWWPSSEVSLFHPGPPPHQAASPHDNPISVTYKGELDILNSVPSLGLSPRKPLVGRTDGVQALLFL